MMIPIGAENERKRTEIKEICDLGYRFIEEYSGASPLDLISRYTELEESFLELYPNIKSLDDFDKHDFDELTILREVMFDCYGHCYIMEIGCCEDENFVCSVYEHSPNPKHYQRQKGIITSLFMYKNGESPFQIIDILDYERKRVLLFFGYNVYTVKTKIKGKIEFIKIRTNDLLEVGNYVKYRIEDGKYFGKIN